jgi:hypothetical protein
MARVTVWDRLPKKCAMWLKKAITTTQRQQVGLVMPVNGRKPNPAAVNRTRPPRHPRHARLEQKRRGRGPKKFTRFDITLVTQMLTG